MANKNSIKVYELYKTRILSKISDLKGKKVLLLCIGNTKLIKEIASTAKEVIIIDEFWFSDTLFGCKYFKFINNIDYLYKLFKNLDMTFDVVLMNPPFSKNLHIKILRNVVKYSDIVVNISPDLFLIDPYAKFEKEKEKRDGREELSKLLIDLEHINQQDSNKIFGINDYTGKGIMIFKQKPDTLVDLTQYESKNSLVNKIVSKIIKMKSLRSQFTKEAGPYFVKVRRRTHHYLSWIEKDNKNIDAKEGINFKTNIEEINFRNSFDTWFYKFMNITDFDDSENSATMPFMLDYTNPWDNKRFCEYFEITGYISDTEAEPNSDWEIILSEITK